MSPIEQRFVDALQLVLDRISDLPINWVITGSLGMALQGLPVEVHDIDLQTDRAGAFQIGEALREFELEPVREVQSERISSYLGRFLVRDVAVEVMGDLRKKVEDGWDEPVNLNHYRHQVKFNGVWLPVLSIAYEAEAYARLGRAEKAALLRRWAAEHPEARPEAITNFIQISPELGTGGQPLPSQIAALGQHGYNAVVNLARTDQPASLREESDLVRAAGMEYVSIPVTWESPQREDLERFYAAMDARRGQQVFVHCVLNYRVSAFVYLYRVARLGVPADEARRDLLRAWTPNERWVKFIEENSPLPRPASPPPLS